ncbi:MAG TPA: P-loop NTPase [Anaeromyxobacter sp.]
MEARSLVVYGPAAGGGPEGVSRLAADLGLRVEPLASEPVDGVPAAAELALVSVAPDADAAFRAAAALARGGARVVVQGPAKDADLILRALRAGAHEYVVVGDADGLRRALGARNHAAAEARGTVTAVLGAKGGLGATTVAANLAGTLQASGARTCILDLDPALGAVCAVLDVAPAYTIADLVANQHRLDRDLLDRSLPHHRSGIAVVAPGDDVEAAERVDGGSVPGLLAFLRRHFDAVVVDGLRGFDDRSLAALDAADRVLLLVTQEVPAVRNAQRCLELFRKLGYADAKVHVVLNRFQRGAAIGREIVEETLEAAVATTLANDFAAVSRAVGKGALLVEEAPRAQVTRDVAALAPLAGLAPADARPRSLLARIFSRGGGTHGAR